VAGGSFILIEIGKWIAGRKRAKATAAETGKVAITAGTEGGK
jgi:hypothetical protein